MLCAYDRVAEQPAEKAEKATPTHAAAGPSKSPKKSKAAKQASKLPAEEPKTAKEKATNQSSARAPVGPSKSPKKAKAAKQASKLPAEEPKTAKEKATNKSSARAPVGSSAVPKTPKEAAAGGSKAAPAAAPSTATALGESSQGRATDHGASTAAQVDMLSKTAAKKQPAKATSKAKTVPSKQGTNTPELRFKKDSGDSMEGVFAISGLVPKFMNPTPASALSSIWGYIPAWLFNPGYARDTIRDVLTSKAVNTHAKKTVPFMKKNAQTNLYYIFVNGYLGLFATHGSQHLVDPSSGVKILSLVTLNARVPGGSGSAGTYELPIEVLSPPTDDLVARELHMPHVHDLASEFEVARYIGNRQNITNANTTINTQLDNYRLLRKEYEMLREIDDKRLEGEGDEEEFSYKRWSSESKDDLVTDPVMKEKYSRFSYLWKSCGFALKRNPENVIVLVRAGRP
eukprot:jgi/Tetstr1/438895/TSEL_027403.t1